MKTVLKDGYYFLWCEGCKQKHLIPVAPSENGSKWNFNGDFEKPTFTPSVLIRWPEGDVQKMCHFNVTDGMITFHNDGTTHDKAGHTLPLIDL